MARTDGPALRRAAAHLGALALTGTLLWRLRATAWAVPLLVAHGYVLAFVFCVFHETAHRTAFRTRWLNTALGHPGRAVDRLAVPELSRLSLGASPLHPG